MALNEDQQRELETLTKLASTFMEEAGQYEDLIRRADVIKKFDTRGQPMDLSQLSMQELQDMFDVGRNMSATNEVDTLINEHGAAAGLDYQYGSDYLVGHNITSARGPESTDAKPEIGQPEVIVPANRQYMESAVGQWMQSLNYAPNPRELLQAEMIVRDSPAGNLGNRRNALTEKYDALKTAIETTTGQPFSHAGIEDCIKALKESEKAYDMRAAAFKAEAASRAPVIGVEFAAQMGFDARQTAFEILEVSDMDKTRKANLSGANIKNLDLSLSDLSNVQIDAETLSRANGLDTVKGVEPRLLAEAQAIKPHVERLDDLNARLAKLENKGGVIDNLRNLRHGGLEGERKHLLKEIDKAQDAMAQAKQGVEAQFPRVQNEFEPKAVYEVGGDVTRRQEAPKDPRLEAMQASVTFRLDSESALNNHGSKVAFAKAQIGTKSADMRANGAKQEEVEAIQGLELNAFGNVAPLHGTSAAVNDANFANSEAMKAAVGSDISSLLTRSVATSTVDKALGMNCMAQEAIGIDEGGRAVGISVGVAGAPILKRPDSVDGKEAFLDIDYSDSAIQKGLYDLEAQDYITGQIDRHTGNIFIDPHTGQVSGIDNDLAFPTVDREDMIRQAKLDGKAIPGKPQFMHTDTAAKIEALTPEALREALQSIERPPGVAPLEPAAIDGAVQRLQELQAEIKVMRKEGRVVDNFDDKTYEAAINRQEEKGLNYIAPRTSYLASAVLEREKSISMGEQRDIVQKENVPQQTAPDPKFAAYQQGVQDAKAQIAANPNLLQDAGLAKSIQDSQTRLASLQDELAEQNRHLTAAGARLDQARMDGDAALEEGFTEIYDNAQQARQDTLQKIANEQRKLDAALDQAVEPRKEQIAQQARQAVQQIDVAQQVKVAEIEPEEIKLEKSVEIPLTESQIREIEEAEQNLGPADYHVEIEEEETGLGIEEENPGIQMVEVPDENVEIQEPDVSLQHEEPKVDLEPAVPNSLQPSPAVESPQEDGPRTRLQSVRDALKGAASTVKNAAVERLDRKGDEQSLKEVRDRSPELIDRYKDLQKELSGLKKLPAADGPNKIDAALGDADAYGQFKQGSPDIAQREKEIKAEMAQMKEENPGLAQLDRSKVGQVVHSGVRDAAKSAANKIR